MDSLPTIGPFAAVIAAAVTAGVGFYWNRQSAKAARKLPFLKQLDCCFEAIECVALLATTSDSAKWEENRDRFWQLYYGVLAVVEGRNVESCMVACSAHIPPIGPAPALPVGGLSDLSLALSLAVRKLLIDAWSIESLAATLEGRTGVFEQVRQAYVTEYQRQMSRAP